MGELVAVGLCSGSVDGEALATRAGEVLEEGVEVGVGDGLDDGDPVGVGECVGRGVGVGRGARVGLGAGGVEGTGRLIPGFLTAGFLAAGFLGFFGGAGVAGGPLCSDGSYAATGGWDTPSVASQPGLGEKPG